MTCNSLFKRHYNKLFNLFQLDEADQLESYYEKHSNIMDTAIFKDTYIVCRFIPLYYDIIIKSQSSIEYFMRNGLAKSKEFYNYITYNDFGILDFIMLLKDVPREILTAYQRDMYTKIIVPTLKRHEVYSEGVMEILFYKLVIYTLSKYSYDDLAKNTLRDWNNTIHEPQIFTQLEPFASNTLSTNEFKSWNKIYSNKNGRRDRPK
jgi:hypothetical protein